MGCLSPVVLGEMPYMRRDAGEVWRAPDLLKVENVVDMGDCHWMMLDAGCAWLS